MRSLLTWTMGNLGHHGDDHTSILAGCIVLHMEGRVSWTALWVERVPLDRTSVHRGISCTTAFWLLRSTPLYAMWSLLASIRTLGCSLARGTVTYRCREGIGLHLGILPWPACGTETLLSYTITPTLWLKSEDPASMECPCPVVCPESWNDVSCPYSSQRPWGSRPLVGFPFSISHPDGEITSLHKHKCFTVNVLKLMWLLFLVVSIYY